MTKPRRPRSDGGDAALHESSPPGLAERVMALLRGTPLERPLLAFLPAFRRLVFRLLFGQRAMPPMWVPPGHFYSPVPSVDDIAEHGARMALPLPETLRGIDLRLEQQLVLLSELTPFYEEAPFPARQVPEMRFCYENGFFGYGDALAFHCMLRRLEPKQVVEVGSGWSSCLLLDTCEQFLDWRPRVTLIEPYPDQLRQLLRPDDFSRLRLISDRVQTVPLSEFEALGPGDILFIDSTHVSRVGSDVNFEIFEVLPSLRSDVYVHIHDVSYPFDYSVEWVREGRAWNEAYLLRAFLEFNEDFEVILFNDLLRLRHADRLAAALPLWLRDPGTSFWMRRR